MKKDKKINVTCRGTACRAQNSKGITLVALILTIIILIILAGVGISVAIGQNGIFTKSKEGVSKYQDSVKREESELDKAFDTIESLDPNSLAAKVKIGDYVNYTPKAGETTTISQGSYDRYVEYSNGTGYLNWKTINEDGETTANGEFGSGYSSDQIFKVPTDTSNIKWRVLSIEDGCVNLISEKEIGRNGQWTGDSGDALYLKDITGYAYGVDVINEVCSIYGTGEGAKSARGITVEEVNKLTGYDPKTGYYGTGNRNYYGNSYGWDDYSWIFTYYYYTTRTDQTTSDYDLEISEDIRNLLFSSDLSDNHNNSSKKYNYSYYWLASRCVDSSSSNVPFRMRRVSDGMVRRQHLVSLLFGW